MKKTEQSSTTAAQKYMGNKRLVVFLAALTAFPALSADLYLPALPDMMVYFNASEFLTTLTLVLFFISYGGSALIWGPLSDRYGRKPILLIGLACYTVAGVLCTVSASIFQLIVFRVLQAVGAGAAVAMATAIVKDAYEYRKREVTLAVIQTMTVLSPAIAPVIGAFILRFTSWRGAFVAQTIAGGLMLLSAFLYQETLQKRLEGNPLRSLGRLGAVMQNRTFTLLIIIFSLLSMPIMAFISSSSYIFKITFGQSSQVYSYFFALFAVGSGVGAQIYVLISRRLSRNSIITGCFIASAVSGLLILLFGNLGPWPFILAFLPLPIASSCMRPPSAYLMLGQHEGDAGSVSAVMTSGFMVTGGIGMVLASLELWDRVYLMGTLSLVLAALSLILWVAVGLPRVRTQELDAAPTQGG